MKIIASHFNTVLLVLAASLLAVSCGGDEGDHQESSRSEAGTDTAKATAQTAQKKVRGGSITVADQTWNIVPSIQCGVYPNGMVAIAGHAESDPTLEIVIDYEPGGLTGVRIGSDRGSVSWHAVRETLKVEISGKQVSGKATFSTFSGGSGETAAGEFIVNC